MIKDETEYELVRQYHEMLIEERLIKRQLGFLQRELDGVRQRMYEHVNLMGMKGVAAFERNEEAQKLLG
jgi:hypothetical protein